jgi:E3 ubiquitin-protein ligase MARCH6
MYTVKLADIAVRAWWVNDRARPPQSPLRYYPFLANVSVVDNDNATDATVLSFAHGDPLWRAVSSDIFTGQIIASLIVLAFLAVFLLREWIMQNARPGVFDDEVQHELEAPDGQRDEPAQIRDVQVEPQVAAPPAENDGSDNMLNTADTGEIAAQVEEAADTVASTSADPRVGAALDINSGQQSFVNEEWHTILDETWGTAEDQEEPESQHSSRRRRLTQNSDSRRHRDRDMRHHRHHSHFRARQTHVNFKGKGKSTAHHREDVVGVQGETIENGHCESSMPTDSYQFTFSLGTVSPSTPSSSGTAVSAASPSASTFSFAARPDIEDRLNYTSPTQLPHPIAASSSENPASSSASTSTTHLAFARRPPLFQSAEASAVDSDHPKEALVLTTPTPRTLDALSSGLPSPSLALYQAPEELFVAGPSQPVQSTSSSVDDGKPVVGVPSDDCAEAQASFEQVQTALEVTEDNSEETEDNMNEALDIYFAPPTTAREGEADSDGEDEDEGWEDIPDAAEEAAVDLNRGVIDVFVDGVAGRVGAGDGGAAGALGGVRIGGNERDGEEAGRGENGQEGERRDGREEDVNEEGEGVQDEDMDGVLEGLFMPLVKQSCFSDSSIFESYWDAWPRHDCLSECRS